MTGALDRVGLVAHIINAAHSVQTLVNPKDNTRGVIVRTLVAVAANAESQVYVVVARETPEQHTAGAAGVILLSRQHNIPVTLGRAILVPAGHGIYAMPTRGGVQAWITYDLVPEQ